VPALQGLSQSDAIARLRQLGFRVQVSTMDDILDSPGQVRGQTPDPGTVRLPGTVVSITVSVKPWWWVF
jgi:beta-lactam-binding protein with PASTA domain